MHRTKKISPRWPLVDVPVKAKFIASFKEFSLGGTRLKILTQKSSAG